MRYMFLFKLSYCNDYGFGYSVLRFFMVKYYDLCQRIGPLIIDKNPNLKCIQNLLFHS